MAIADKEAKSEEKKEEKKLSDSIQNAHAAGDGALERSDEPEWPKKENGQEGKASDIPY